MEGKMEFDAVFTVKKEIKKEEFLRQLLINLGTHPDTPADVVKAKIGEVKENIKEIIVCTAKVSGVCNASIGYDRQEPYTDYETYQEKVGNNYVTKQRQVTKYRTVTDWHPFNTQYSGEAIGVANNDENCLSEDNTVTAIKTAKSSSIVPKGEATICQEGLDWALWECKNTVQNNSVRFPGDRYKDVKFNSTADIESVVCYKLPSYKVSFTYGKKTYQASCFACGNIVVNYDVPKRKVDADTEVKEMTKLSEEKAKKAWWICYGALGITAVFLFWLNFAWLWPVSIATLVYAIMKNRNYNREYEAGAQFLSADIASTKITELKEALSLYGYEELRDKEESLVKTQGTPSIKKPKSFIAKAIICTILAFILTGSSLGVSSVIHTNNLHSPKTVSVVVSGMSHAYKEDYSYYSYGSYYIYTDFKVSTKRIGVESVRVTVRVKDKTGNELGTLSSTLNNMNLDPGCSKTVTTVWEESQPENNAVFTQIYNSNFDELIFEIEILSIGFSDGNSYYHV